MKLNVYQCPDCGEMVHLRRVGTQRVCPLCGVIQETLLVDGTCEFREHVFEKMCRLLKADWKILVITKSRIIQREYKKALKREFASDLLIEDIKASEDVACQYSLREE